MSSGSTYNPALGISSQLPSGIRNALGIGCGVRNDFDKSLGFSTSGCLDPWPVRIWCGGPSIYLVEAGIDRSLRENTSPAKYIPAQATQSCRKNIRRT